MAITCVWRCGLTTKSSFLFPSVKRTSLIWWGNTHWNTVKTACDGQHPYPIMKDMEYSYYLCKSKFSFLLDYRLSGDTMSHLDFGVFTLLWINFCFISGRSGCKLVHFLWLNLQCIQNSLDATEASSHKLWIMQNSIPSGRAPWTVPMCVFVCPCLYFSYYSLWTITLIEKYLTSTLFSHCKPPT